MKEFNPFVVISIAVLAFIGFDYLLLGGKITGPIFWTVWEMR